MIMTTPAPSVEGTGAAGTGPCSGLVGPGDVAPPAAGLGAAALDEFLELLRVGLDLPVVEAQCGAGLLDQPLGLPVDLDHDAGLAVVQPVERHDAGVLRLTTGG